MVDEDRTAPNEEINNHARKGTKNPQNSTGWPSTRFTRAST